MCFTVKQTLRSAASFLRIFDNPTLESSVLLAGILDKSVTWLRTHDDVRLSWLVWLRFWWMLSRRRSGWPVAYILGYKDWYGQRFAVSPAVLIPRSETETLLHHILERNHAPKSVLDLGTGSGCLAIELKRAWPEATVLALDISNKALRVAKKNARLHGQSVSFQVSDLLLVLPDKAHIEVIVANLPYVPEDLAVTKEVQHEPHGAIFSGADGLDHYRRLHEELNNKSVQFGELWLEFLPSQKTAIETLYKEFKVEFKSDVAGNFFFAKITPIV